jgi:hypothetical protein
MSIFDFKHQKATQELYKKLSLSALFIISEVERNKYNKIISKCCSEGDLDGLKEIINNDKEVRNIIGMDFFKDAYVNKQYNIMKYLVNINSKELNFSILMMYCCNNDLLALKIIILSTLKNKNNYIIFEYNNYLSFFCHFFGMSSLGKYQNIGNYFQCCGIIIAVDMKKIYLI